MSTLAVIPTFIRSERDRGLAEIAVRTLHEHEPDLDVLAVDDCSPEQGLVDSLERRNGFVEVVRKDENEGFSRTVNVGLRRALEQGRDAVLVNADMEFTGPWLADMVRTRDSRDESPAAVVGALLLYPSGLIQHAGIFASFLDRSFDHRMRFAPGNLPEAQVPAVCPVTGALQFIRHSTLEAVGLYDEEFRLGFEDVDYCLRVFEAGLECVYQPRAMAIHHESAVRGQRSERIDGWHRESLGRLMTKHGSTDIGKWIFPLA